jgi:hypothetical protein
LAQGDASAILPRQGKRLRALVAPPRRVQTGNADLISMQELR